VLADEYIFDMEVVQMTKFLQSIIILMMTYFCYNIATVQAATSSF